MGIYTSRMRAENFRRGRGRIRELRKAFSPEAIAYTREWLNPWCLRWMRYQQAMSARTL